MESMQEYVIRKIKEPQININALAKEVGISRSTLYGIINGKNTSYTTIDILNNYFKKTAD